MVEALTEDNDKWEEVKDTDDQSYYQWVKARANNGEKSALDILERNRNNARRKYYETRTAKNPRKDFLYLSLNPHMIEKPHLTEEELDSRRKSKSDSEKERRRKLKELAEQGDDLAQSKLNKMKESRKSWMDRTKGMAEQGDEDALSKLKRYKDLSRDLAREAYRKKIRDSGREIRGYRRSTKTPDPSFVEAVSALRGKQ